MSRITKIANCSLIDLPKISNRKGNITPLHSSIDIPFDIKRIYYLYDVPGGVGRGGHAHRSLKQLIFPYLEVTMMLPTNLLLAQLGHMQTGKITLLIM